MREIAAAAAHGAGDSPAAIKAYASLCRALDTAKAAQRGDPGSRRAASSQLDDRIQRLTQLLDVDFKGFPVPKESLTHLDRAWQDHYKEIVRWGDKIAAEAGCKLDTFGGPWYLRGSEPLEWAVYLESGGYVMPLSSLVPEYVDVDVAATQ